ncbi:ABC transporter ATP-binding protein [Bacillus sp. P14.5]|uniref:ABC transporter ATP-binding protein n=1 Tax=Bacillus sp. P14.5 TaxID=1983400 RepID=UPI000DE995CB|nr:ABC transporter ATP-binding protein [Bacillus sp. P14.5]
MIEFKKVRKKFEDGTEAIKGIDLVIPEGELTALIGPSGCGKTTTMKMINKLIVPTDGKIYINGEEIASKNEVELRRNIGYVIQRIGLLPHMTIEENIALIPKLKGWKKEEYSPRVNELMELVGLEPEVYKKRYPLELSGGQQQRVGVIRALAAEPPIILMDEPFSALDPISREQLQDELKSLQQKIHKTIVFVTHDMDEALKIADNIAVMRDGVIEQYGSPDELLSSPANEFVKAFIGEHRINKGQAGLYVRDVMSSGSANIPGNTADAISSGSTISQAAGMLLKSKLDGLKVMENGEVIGFVTSEDILQAIADKEGPPYAG